MPKNFLAVSLACTLLFTACTKNNSLKNTEVSIRVQNATTENFTGLTFINSDFGSINAGDSTAYKTFQKVIPHPFANYLAINNHMPFIVDVVPGLYLENGKYTLQILTDTLPYRYKASFIKE